MGAAKYSALEMYLYNKYNCSRLNTAQVAKELDVSLKGLQNNPERYPFMYKDGHWYANIKEMAEHISSTS